VAQVPVAQVTREPAAAGEISIVSTIEVVISRRLSIDRAIKSAL